MCTTRLVGSLFTLFVTGLLVAACGIPKAEHQTTVNKLRSTEQQLGQASRRAEQEKARADAAERRATTAKSALETARQKLESLSREATTLRTDLQGCKKSLATAQSVGAKGREPKARPSETTATVSGDGLQGRVVRRIVRRLLHRIQACYDRRVRGKRKKLGGRIVATFEINPRGRVRRVKAAQDTVRVAAHWRCMRRVIERARFPRHKTKTVVSYPFIFRAK